MATPQTALGRSDQSLVLPIGLSLVFHAAAVVFGLVFRGALSLVAGLVFALFPFCAPKSQPLIQESVQVAVVSLPKSATKMPDRAARRPRPVQGTKPTPAPPPVKESELVHETEEPPPEPGTPEEAPDDSPTREELLEENRRQQLLDELLNAPEGPEDRNATDPEGTGDAALASLSATAMGDAAYAKWELKVQDLVRSRFTPVGAREGLTAVGNLRVDPETGKVLSYELSKRSGVLAFDAAVERALAGVREIPLPPEKYRPLLEQYRIPVDFVSQ